MLILKSPVAPVNASTVARMLEQKRAVELMPNQGAGALLLTMVEKYADTFASVIAAHQPEALPPQTPVFPIEV
ncbi:hypothetical protein PSTH1771_14265 [Pseudomonas syringae pv. theae]|uniref:hypothetical protein n=1 Tax=Pseudomonas syringae TaxID=317 RepID=UPI0011C3564A|nr:hypothetical protein [Pseudomonas syringae]GKQ29490.1 hypothetical protein PSTH68_08245 [Pseudomonas syringae pv. theae]GKQ48962.1 hypothetical protein PSTH2693_27420 [Pseudomonas syringae pv. theae]GKS06191.1 hypothetical protein PSTH1771_14265 [Pseudomonas syringae pv. theae]